MACNPPPPEGLRRSLSRVKRHLKEKIASPVSRHQRHLKDPQLAALQYTFAASSFDLPLSPTTSRQGRPSGSLSRPMPNSPPSCNESDNVTILSPITTGPQNIITIRMESPQPRRPGLAGVCSPKPLLVDGNIAATSISPEILDFRNVVSNARKLKREVEQEPRSGTAPLEPPVFNIESPRSPQAIVFPSMDLLQAPAAEATGLLNPNDCQQQRSAKSSLLSTLYPPSSLLSAHPIQSVTSVEETSSNVFLGVREIEQLRHTRAASAPVDHPRNSVNSRLALRITPTASPFEQQWPPSASSISRLSVRSIKESAWTVLEGMLRTLGKCAEGVPLLKSTVDMLVSCIDNMQEANKHRRDYEELANSLIDVTARLTDHLKAPNSTKLSSCVLNLLSSLQEQMDHIRIKQQRSPANRLVGANEDREDLVECYRRIEMLFRRLESDAVLSVWSIANEQLAGYRLDSMTPAQKARYNSNISLEVRRRRCTSNTRKLTLDALDAWARDPQSSRIYWMNGMAGTGKTTIAYSFCERLDQQSRLGASFFCCRDLPECRDVARVIPTIAYQLARASLPFQSALCKILAQDPDISSYAIPMQFEKLIYGPFQETGDAWPSDMVVIIDALDEFGSQEGAQLILDTLVHSVESLPIKVLVTGRPDPSIQSRLSFRADWGCPIFHLHEVEESLVQADIETYLAEELSPFSLNPDKIKLLAKRAKNLFIYAATAVRYIQPSSVIVNRHQRLDIILGVYSHSGSRKNDELDTLYSAILAAALEHRHLDRAETEATRRVLNTVICAREPMSTQALAELLELTVQEVELSIQQLQSVLYVSGRPSRTVSAFHISFADYLLDRERSGRFYCDLQAQSDVMVQRCLRTMLRMLRFNICKLRSPFAFDRNVPELQEQIAHGISPELLYACRYWGDHLEPVGSSSETLKLVDAFISGYLLFWMEVLNLTSSIDTGGKTLLQAHLWLENHPSTDNLRILVLDARKFTIAFSANSISQSTPHIYISALTFWPRSEPMWQAYGNFTGGLVQIRGTAMNSRDTSNVVVWNLPSRIACMAISPDGCYIASGSDDCLIRICDFHSGKLVIAPLTGHNSRVVAISYSSDGQKLVSGSDDCTIRVWDTQTGLSLAGPISMGSYVNSVAFAPSSGYVVVGSFDNTISVWDARRGIAIGRSSMAHIDSVQSLAVSSSGEMIASGSDDCTLRIWDTGSQNALAGPFGSREKPVRSVAFSPDGNFIASGLDDGSVELWSIQDGPEIPAASFVGHTEPITWVTFSPDGAYIASSSQDHTVRVWSVRDKSLASGPLKGHTDTVTSVAFTPDGSCVVSSSLDKSIRVWDAHSGRDTSASVDGHSGQVCAVALSPEGTRAVSTSLDCTIRFWDASTGAALRRPLQKHNVYATSASYSPKDSRVAIGFQDHTIYVLDTTSGEVVAGPLSEHDSWVTCVSFSPDGKLIASGCASGVILIWDMRSRRMATRSFKHTSSVRIRSVAFSPDGKRLVSSYEDGTISLWDLRSGRKVDSPFQGHTGSVRSVAFSPGGIYIASGSDDRTVRIWNAQSGQPSVEPLWGHTDTVNAVAFSPRGALVISASRDHTVRVWDTLTGGDAVRVLRAHTDSIECISVSPNGSHVVTGSSDRVVRIWDLNTVINQPVDAFHDWDMNEDGWVVNRDGQLLVWVPNDLRAGLVHPQNRAVIHRRGSLELGFSESYQSGRWIQNAQ